MFTPNQLIALLDLTTLNDNDTNEIVLDLCQQAQTAKGKVAAVCVYPKFVTTARQALPQDIAVATVINFPHGNTNLIHSMIHTQSAIEQGANEIDVVQPYQALQAGQSEIVRHYIQNIAQVCHQHNTKLKVILETGALTPDEIRQSAQIAIEAGADFLKTSTGKIPVGATPEAAAILLEEIQRSGKPVGIKLSGGVRDIEAAQHYAEQAAHIMGKKWVNAQNFRIGASSLLDALLKA